MSDRDKVLGSTGLEHLIALIKGADEGLRKELSDLIESSGDGLRDEFAKLIDEKVSEAISSSGPGLRADEVTITNDGGTLSVKDLGIGTDQLADGSVTRDKLSFNPTDGIDAAPRVHKHDASDVTTGVLAVERGGTGVSTDDAAFQKYVTSHYLDNDELLAYLGLS